MLPTPDSTNGTAIPPTPPTTVHQAIEDTHKTLASLAAMSFVLLDLLEYGGDVSQDKVHACVRLMWHEAERGMQVCEVAEALAKEVCS